MSYQEQIQIQPILKSRFVTYLGAISIILSVFTIYQDVSNLQMMNSLQSRPEFRIAEQMMPSLTISPTETIVEIILYIAGIIASIVLLNRLDWGRVMYLWVLTTITVWGVISSISSYLSVEEYLKGYGGETPLMLIFLGNVFSIGINIYLAKKLTSIEIRNEFLRR